MRIRLREAKQKDIREMAELFRETVKTVNVADYSIEETEDWAACGEDVNHWKELIGRLHFVVAEVVTENNNRAMSDDRTGEEEMIGFASIGEEGYLHSMFVHQNFQRCGVATALLQTMERYAEEKGMAKIISEVSITARPFFENAGYRIVEQQKRRAQKLELTNFLMEKRLTCGQ